MATDPPGVPWIWRLTWLLPAGGLVLVLRGGLGSETVAPWPGVGAAMLLASAAFFVGTWLNQLSWGLATSLILILHPLFGAAAKSDATPLLAEALGLGILAATLGAWRLTFNRRFSWPGWGLVGLGWIVSLAVLWTMEPHAALVGSQLVLLGSLVALVLVFRLGLAQWAWARLVVMGLTCLAALVAGFLTTADFPDRLRASLVPDFWGSDQVGYAAAFAAAVQEVREAAWCWPARWVVYPLMAWGFWRTLRRGWKLYAQGQPPFTWLLALYTVVNISEIVVHPGSARQTGFLPLAIVSVLLAVFCIADLFRGLGERLVLTPPGGDDKVTG